MGPSQTSSLASARLYEGHLRISPLLVATILGTHLVALTPAFASPHWRVSERVIWLAPVLGSLVHSLVRYAWRGRMARALQLRTNGHMRVRTSRGSHEGHVIATHVIGPFLALRWQTVAGRATLVVARDGCDDWRGLRRALARLPASEPAA
ncbi:protein YgfX [Arhodomonas sp. AD133]|uniref:protein YgfX n=1 Tax=Arhodomonas sp. AD133 TaxID=3415009 RepID=UPI003EB92288